MTITTGNTSNWFTSRAASLLYMLVLLLASYMLFAPGIQGPWQLDDRHNIVNLANLQPGFIQEHGLIEASKLNQTWGSRPVSRLSFAATVRWCGQTPGCFKTGNILLHWLTALCLYFLIILIAQLWLKEKSQPPLKNIRFFALACAAIWCLHPIQVSTVLYAVQRMTILSALFSMIAFLCYFYWRRRPSYRSFALCFPVFTISAGLAFLSKENAALIPLFILSIELFIPNKKNTPLTTQFLLLGFGTAIVVCALIGFWFYSHGNFFEQFSNRAYSPWERLLTQSRVLFHYLYWLLIPAPQHYTLFHDDIVISSGIFSPISTFISIFLITVTSSFLWLARKKYCILAFAWFWFLIGHSIESSFLNLELVFEHRNYLPMIGPIIALVYCGHLIYQRFGKLALITLAALFIHCVSVTFQKSLQWRSDGTMLQYESKHHPNSVRLNYKTGILWLQLALSPKTNIEQKRYYTNRAQQQMQLVNNINSWNIQGPVGLLYLQARGVIAHNNQDWIELRARLESIHYSPETAQLLAALTNCELKGICNTNVAELIETYETIIGRDLGGQSQLILQVDLARLRKFQTQ